MKRGSLEITNTLKYIVISLLTVIILTSFFFVKIKFDNTSDDLIAVYLDEEKVNAFPSKDSGYKFKEAKCSNGENGYWDIDNWQFIFNTSNKTRCKLYFVKVDQTAVEYINNLDKEANFLVEDETSDNNLRYIGANPNNYVKFNDELWRIVGVFNNIDTISGEKKSLIKIRRKESLGNYAWDTSDSSINEGIGINQWGQSSGYDGADIMKELNTDYLGSVMVGTDGKWYSDKNNGKTSDMPASSINFTSKKMIETVTWNLGSSSVNSGNNTYDANWQSTLTASISYKRERANTHGKICTSGTRCDDTIVRTSTWIGKIGLLYFSDYSYATSGGTTNDRRYCLSLSQADLRNLGDGKKDCLDNNWLFSTADYQWAMTPAGTSYSSHSSFLVRNDKTFTVGTDYGIAAIYPTLYLKSSISIIAGDGSEDNPYILG